MEKYIVITTINKPTEATLKYIDFKEWNIIIVGDKKTPHECYKNLGSNVFYMTPEYQEQHYKEYSDHLGWNLSPRRNLGFIEAYHKGADILALVDDDNIPYDNWDKDIVVGKDIEIDCYKENSLVFDPLSITNNKHLWHRGFPIDEVRNKNPQYIGKIKTKIFIQENMWDGNPDIDAIQRMIYHHEVKFTYHTIFTSTAKFMPFNSQNTFLDRSMIPHYMLLPNIGRVDDIWGSYLLQKQFSYLSPYIAYGHATVYQKRNEHNILDDFNKEIYSYENCSKFLRDEIVLPLRTIENYKLYRKQFIGE